MTEITPSNPLAAATATSQDALDVVAPQSPATVFWGQMKKSPLNYPLLAELNTRPRTTYMAIVRNPNTTLEPTPAASEARPSPDPTPP